MRKLLLSIASLAFILSASAAEGWPANYKGVMLQGFWWDSYAESQWSVLTGRADELSTYFDLIWIPNAGTTSGGKYDIEHGNSIRQTMGYDPCFWLEYNSCFGTETELLEMIDTYKQHGTGIIEDVVINHKNGISGWCDFVNEEAIGRYTGKTYSLTWDNTNYSGICSNDEANYEDKSEAKGKITGKEDTGDGFPGYRDLDHTNTLVQQNIKTYQDYLLKEVGFAGFRLDMVKGYSPYYTGLYNTHSNPKFSVGEYWDANKDAVTWWIRATGYTSAAFDFPLKYTINSVFGSKNWGDMSDKSFTADASMNRYSVTFADNHDTFREESCPLSSSWTAANAFLLAMPGTPCIFFKHYEVDKTHIQPMILARKACGISNQSTILQQYQSGNGYVIETQGNYGRIYLQLGDATGQGAPNGYTLVTYGTSDNDDVPYKFYKNENTPEQKKYEATIYNNQELSAFFETSAGSVKIYTWDSNNQLYSGSWPGIGMELMGKAWNGNNIFKWTYSGSLNSAPNKVIFVPEGGNQTADLDFVNHGFYLDGTGYSSTITSTREGTYTVYFDASNSDWTNVHAYVWQGGSGIYETAWPGTQIQMNADGLYSITFDGKYDRIQFNDGTNQKQTANYTVLQGNIYNASYNTNHTRYDLADGTAITPSMAGEYEDFTYSRKYNGNWQALYVPFSIPYAAWGNDFQIAEPSSCDGEYMKLRKLSAGEATEANGIYFIKALTAETKTLKLQNITIDYPEADTELTVGDYVFHGTSTGITRGEWDASWYAMGNSGALAPTNVSDLTGNTILLKAQRWYLVAPAGAPAKLRLEDDSDGIETVSVDPEESTVCYDLQGRRVALGTKGFLIINGKKCIIK